jgi:hypothetical protein
MKRKAIMRRSGIGNSVPRPSKTYEVYTPRPREAAVRVHDGRARMVVQVPKMEPVRHEGYRRLVALLPCLACGIAQLSQAAHPNTGKGQGLKTDDRECFPLCTDRPLQQGCHPLFDQGVMFPKEQRREIEPVWGRQTRARIRAMGMWPADLPPWPEDDDNRRDAASTEGHGA